MSKKLKNGILTLLSTLPFLFLANKGWSQKYSLDYLVDAPYFVLQIAPTFDNPIEYELLMFPTHKLVKRIYSGKGGYDWGAVSDVTTVELTNAQFSFVRNEILAVLTDIPTNDRYVAPDSDTWVIESNASQYLKVAVNDPEISADLRGYLPLIDLAKKIERKFK